jgi:ABC-type microcin C transport system duplicated ATPase subunit YejF
VQLVFQDPFASLNPRMTVPTIVGAPLTVHRRGSRAEREGMRRLGCDRSTISADWPTVISPAFASSMNARTHTLLGSMMVKTGSPAASADPSSFCRVITMASYGAVRV